MKIAFILLHYPVFSETFVLDEIYQLQQQKINCVIWHENKDIPTKEIQPIFHKINFPHFSISSKILKISTLKSTLSSHYFWLKNNPSGYFKSIQILFSMFTWNHLRVFIKSTQIAQQIYDQKCTIIYTHEQDSSSLFSLVSSQLCRIPCGIIFHTFSLFVETKFLNVKLKQFDFLIFQSHYSQKIALSSTHQKNISKKSFVIYSPGINTDFFSPPSQPKFNNSILSIGRLEEAKGYPNLIDAIHLLQQQNINVKCQIIGSGSQQKMLANKIKKYKLEKNIKLLGAIGHSPQMIKLIHSSDIFILPSVIDCSNVRDVHPFVTKEAMSSGLITVTTKLGGIQEYIHHGQNGFLVPDSTPQSLAKIITQIFKLTKTQKLKIKKSARQTILNQYQNKKMTQLLIQVFTQYSV